MPAASAQVRPTDQISRCTLITDPTAQRACIESATASRPAMSFDPTVRPPQAPRRERDAANAKAAGASTNVDAGAAASAPKAGGGAYRDTKWRLQIP